MPVNVFRWLAPAFGRFGDRWDEETIAQWAGWLEPYMGERRALLDVGGGTGALAGHLADALDARATVLDATPEMVAQMNPHPRVTAVIGPAEAMPFDDDAFDACVVSEAFHHFRDQAGAAREIARVVRQGGGVFVVDFDPRGWMQPGVLVEKILGEPGKYLSPTEMCTFMADFGVQGHCEKTSATAYYFLGTVR